MATSTPPSPPHAAAGSRRPFFIRWWYDPVQRRRAIITTVLALLYGSGLVYGSWTRVCSGDRCPSIMRLQPERHAQLQTSKVYAADGRLISELGIELRTVLPQLDAELADEPAVGGVALGRLQLGMTFRLETHDAGAAVAGANARPRAVDEAAAVEQGQHGRDD